MERKSFVQPPPTLKDELLRLQNKVKSLEERINALEHKSDNNAPIINSPYKIHSMPSPQVFTGDKIDVTGILNQNRRK